MKEREITALEGALQYHFRRRAVIEQAVTHSSQAREQEAQQTGEGKYRVSDNEQLEFLGDAVLALVTSEELFQRCPQFREGELSKLRAHLGDTFPLVKVRDKLRCERCSSRQIVITFLAPDQRTGNLVELFSRKPSG